jgi:hypothetical protein
VDVPESDVTLHTHVPNEDSDEELSLFNLLDLLFAVAPTVHYIWIIIETVIDLSVWNIRCNSITDCGIELKNSWTIYNRIGYSYFNYLFPSYIGVIINCIWKESAYEKIKVSKKSNKEDLICEICSLCAAVAAFSYLAYVFTHIIPLFFAYIWFTFPLLIFLFMPFFFLAWVLSRCGNHRKSVFNPIYFACAISGTYLIVPLLFGSLLYNYSQYLYFGENYIKTIAYEFESRNTQKWYENLKNSTTLKFHTFLDFI